MRIAYLIHWNEGPESGVFKKIISQARTWQALGHETALFLFSRDTAAAWTEAESCGLPVFRVTYRGRLGRAPRFKALTARVRAWKPDVIYHRYDLYYPSLPRLLRDHPSVLEINTDDLAELELESGGLGLRRMYHLLTRRFVLRAAGGFVFVSGELAETASFRRYVKNDYVVIGNGIPLDQFGATAVEDAANHSDSDPVRFVFISSPGQAWQGLDEIARLAAVKSDWQFDIIGPERGELEEAGLQVPANMAFHGQLTRDRYQPLLDQADIAIGTLALYRKGMKEASPLKVREYLANGLPVIAAYRETDFPEPVPIFLQLPGEPANVIRHLSEIERFVREWRGRRVEREQVRHLDVAFKEAARVAYMRRIAGRQEGGG
ncbi:glycosyltransferase [Paenibacillus sp. p3-SID1389]|uniref:glycosyltransferase n=1 Tax=Paenibacillus sp. p3-SID1389 TaxID=2916364 RepID=UPI0021A5DFD5|nr:glycosyltransferase [Paenibacillus sp. p3-SID1389]MCT2194955.1 glycosyltransferase [Paenibacillus sp. p3-SID1389]